MHNKLEADEGHKLWRHDEFAAQTGRPTARPRSAQNVMSPKFRHKFQRRSCLGAFCIDGSRGHAGYRNLLKYPTGIQSINRTNLKQQQATANVKYKALLTTMQKERDASSAFKVTRLEANITELQRMINRAIAAARAANKENTAAVSELETQVQRLNEGHIWARVREEETRHMRAGEARSILQEQVDEQQRELSARSQKVAKERQELAGLRFRCK
eukprot:1297053-Pleurochrysis_carterae.AAC.1